MLRSDAYRELAEALAKRGVATIRYDKRGVGQSTYAGKLSDLGFDDFVSDAAALIAMARVNDKLSGVYVFGHSEGSLIALKPAATSKVDGIISAAGAGRVVSELMREQLARQLSPDDMKDFDAQVAALKAGKPLDPKTPTLQRLLEPSLGKFLKGMLLTDPKPLAATFKGKLTVVQGDNDVQVTVDKDARPLAAAHAGAKLVGAQGRDARAQARRAQGPGSAELPRSVAADRFGCGGCRLDDGEELKLGDVGDDALLALELALRVDRGLARAVIADAHAEEHALAGDLAGDEERLVPAHGSCPELFGVRLVGERRELQREVRRRRVRLLRRGVLLLRHLRSRRRQRGLGARRLFAAATSGFFGSGLAAAGSSSSALSSTESPAQARAFRPP